MSQVSSKILESIATMSRDELNQVIEMVKIRRRHLAEKEKVNFRVDQKVSVSGLRKRGQWTGTHEGVITKKNRKNAKVRIPNPSGFGYTVWSLPYSMLQEVK